jgi:hypothetical protein
MMYISLAQAKMQVRADHDDEDADIIFKVQQASSMVKNYLKGASPFEPLRDGDDNPMYDSNDELIDDVALDDVRYEVKAATQVIFQLLYDRTYTAKPGYLPDEAVSILYPIRDPALA